MDPWVPVIVGSALYHTGEVSGRRDTRAAAIQAAKTTERTPRRSVITEILPILDSGESTKSPTGTSVLGRRWGHNKCMQRNEGATAYLPSVVSFENRTLVSLCWWCGRAGPVHGRVFRGTGLDGNRVVFVRTIILLEPQTRSDIPLVGKRIKQNTVIPSHQLRLSRH